jgi:LAGLIDADG DNA endonuclease family protein
MEIVAPCHSNVASAFGYMLENPSIRPVLVLWWLSDQGGSAMDSDNPEGAENQQERLIRTGWVIGFVDGEGCFSIGFVRQPDRARRRGYKTGYQVSHEFAVTQGAQSVSCLAELREFFGVGQVLINKRYDNHREHLHRYVVRKRADLLETVIPLFRRYPMLSSKQQNFEKFARCVELIEDGHHLSPDGLIEIAEIAQTMNRQKPRHDLIRILRGHTPNTLGTG